jgi:precorrin-3B methylase
MRRMLSFRDRRRLVTSCQGNLRNSGSLLLQKSASRVTYASCGDCRVLGFAGGDAHAVEKGSSVDLSALPGFPLLSHSRIAYSVRCSPVKLPSYGLVWI